MSDENSIICPTSTETIVDTVLTDHDFSEQANLVSDYACMLEEKVQLEKQLIVHAFTNTELVSRLKDMEKSLEDTKSQLRLNDEVVDALRTQLDKNRQALTTGEEVYKNIHEQHETMIAELRDDVKMLRKKLCVTTGKLDRSLGQVDYLKERCVEYKDKLRGFAILFTYFNDPKRTRSDQFISVTDVGSRTSATLATSKSTSNITSAKSAKSKNERGVQQMQMDELLVPKNFAGLLGK